MYYATHKLHLPGGTTLKMYVVEVKAGVAVSFFPFDGERQSMVWVDEIVASHNSHASILSDIKNEAAQDVQPLYLYSVSEQGLAKPLLVPLK